MLFATSNLAGGVIPLIIKAMTVTPQNSNGFFSEIKIHILTVFCFCFSQSQFCFFDNHLPPMSLATAENIYLKDWRSSKRASEKCKLRRVKKVIRMSFKIFKAHFLGNCDCEASWPICNCKKRSIPPPPNSPTGKVACCEWQGCLFSNGKVAWLLFSKQATLPFATSNLAGWYLPAPSYRRRDSFWKQMDRQIFMFPFEHFCASPRSTWKVDLPCGACPN